MSKKATQTHRQWSGTKQVVQMDDEVMKDALEAHGIYSVLKISKGEKGLEYDWGIVILDGEKKIFRNWNINQEGRWDANNCTIRRTWRVFPADQKSRDFAMLLLNVLSAERAIDHFEKRIEEMEQKIYNLEHQSLWERIMNR